MKEFLKRLFNKKKTTIKRPQHKTEICVACYEEEEDRWWYLTDQEGWIHIPKVQDEVLDKMRVSRKLQPLPEELLGKKRPQGIKRFADKTHAFAYWHLSGIKKQFPDMEVSFLPDNEVFCFWEVLDFE